MGRNFIFSCISALFITQSALAAELTTIIGDIFTDASLIGIAAGIRDDTEIIETVVFGIRERGEDAPILLTDKWHIGSISKSITTMVLGTLMADNQLKLDATLPTLLPDIADQMHSDWGNITLRMVLEHRAGLPENFGVGVMLEDAPNVIDRPALRAKALAGILSHPAGPLEYKYSNIGYTLAGHVAEHITGQAWENVVQNRIFTPLDLHTAGFGAPKGTERHDQPVGHASIFGIYHKPMNSFDNRADNSPIIGPAGTVHMSISDLLTYGQSLLIMSKGKNALLTAEIFADLTTPTQGQYAGGLITEQDTWANGTVLWHNGSNTMWYAILVILPDKNRVFAISVNQEGAKVRRAVQNAVKQIIDTL